jgi:hypothetical protein
MTKRGPAPESDHNRLLRRVDWRFLLNDPHPETSICFGNSSLTKAITMVSNQVLAADTVLRAECDLATTFNADLETLHSAWMALKPGGALYAEWSFLPVGRVRHLLQSAGFLGVQCYWSWPSSGRSPLFWAPLGAYGAWRYLIASRPPDRQRWRHWVRWLFRGATYLVQQMGVLAPVYAIAYKPDLANDSTPTATLIDWLRAHWCEWSLGPLPDKLSLMFLTGGLHRSNKIVALVFAEPEAQPRLIIKLPRVAESIAGLQHEANILKAVHVRRKTVIPGVPQVVFCEESRLGETAISGVPLFTQVNHLNYRAWALKATAWLIELAGESRPVTSETRSSQFIEPVLEDFVEKFDRILDRHDVEATRRIIRQVEALPTISEHRDFSPWNALITRSGELGILDWESAELDGLPLLDLIYFLTYLTFFVEGAMETGRFGEAYRTCWSPHTSRGQVNAECVRLYCKALQLDEGCVSALRLFTWLLHSRSEYQRLRADEGGIPSMERLRESVFVVLWSEELRSNQAGRSAVGEA